MKFSVILPSFLGPYRTAAKDRDKKILRAVNSVLSQTFQDFEVIVIADGCEQTVEIMQQVVDQRVSTYLIPKSKIWSGEPRNAGLEKSKGDYIVYLDIDDVFGYGHLQNISDQLNDYDWVWFNDVRYNPKFNAKLPVSDENVMWYENPCDISIIGRHGTSNICHKRSMPARWDHVGYAHDYYFVLQLKQSKNFTKINGGEYYVAHVPGGEGSGGYDL
jgi:glycosyltransferase involved in cell wall biosynthesis